MGATSVDGPGNRCATLLDELLDDGLAPGFLTALPPEAAERLLTDAVRIDVPAGVLVYRSDERPRVIVVVNGVLRVFLRSPDGRQVAIGYVHSGEVAGLVLVLGGPGPISIESVTAASVVALRVETLRVLLATDPGVGHACAEAFTRQLQELFADLSGQAFLTVRQRIILRLLNLASGGDRPYPVVQVSHEELAEAVGSVREVVTRTLGQLRLDGLIETSKSGIGLLDVVRLSREIEGHASATLRAASVGQRELVTSR